MLKHFVYATNKPTLHCYLNHASSVKQSSIIVGLHKRSMSVLSATGSSPMNNNKGPSSAKQTPIVVSKEQIETFQRDGVVLIEGILSKEAIETGRQAMNEAIENPSKYAEFIRDDSTWESVSESFIEQEKDCSRISTNTNNTKPKDDWVMFQDQFSWKRCPTMKSFIHISNAGQIVAELMESKSATFFYDHVIHKRPKHRNDYFEKQRNEKETSKCTIAGDCIPWHQDLTYWCIDGKQIASVWIPFDKMPSPDNSASDGVSWVLGSHKWGLFRPKHFVDGSPYKDTEHLNDMPDIDQILRNGEARSKTFAVQPGDILVFDARIIHGSGTNSSGTDHRRVALRFGGDDCVYFERKGETAIPTPEIKHGLKHGDPLSCEEFPLVWPSAASTF